MSCSLNAACRNPSTISRHGRVEGSSSPVDLGKLRLAVRPQVFVAKAPYDLEVFIEARNHQDLFEELRRLGQRIKRSRIYAAWNQVVARASGVERVMNGVSISKNLCRPDAGEWPTRLVPQLDIELHLRTA